MNNLRQSNKTNKLEATHRDLAQAHEEDERHDDVDERPQQERSLDPNRGLVPRVVTRLRRLVHVAEHGVQQAAADSIDPAARLVGGGVGQDVEEDGCGEEADDAGGKDRRADEDDF